MFVYKGTEAFDIGYGLGNHEYEFFAINGEEDFQLLLEHYGHIFNRFDYFYDRHLSYENNVELSPAVQQKMKEHNANISITLSKEHLISADARTKALYINERTSVVTYDTHFFGLYYFTTEGMENYIDYGQRYFHARQYWGAIRCFTREIMHGQDMPRALIWRGESFIEIGYYKVAIPDFTQAIELDPKKPYPFLLRGIAYQKIGDFEKARADLEKTLELNPSTRTERTAKKILEEIKYKTNA